MAHDAHDPLKHPEVRLVNGRAYVAAFVAATVLMTAALGIAMHPGMIPHAMVGLSAVAALAVTIQILFLLQLDFSSTQIWTTVSFLLAFPLFVIAVGLSLWMFHSLDARTMLTALMH